MSLNKSSVEDAALEWFVELGCAVGNAPHLAMWMKANIAAVDELTRYHSAKKSA